MECRLDKCFNYRSMKAVLNVLMTRIHNICRVSLQGSSGCEYGRNDFFFKELNELRATNEELRRQLGKALETQKMDVCPSCDTQLLCLKCSGLLSQCIVNTSFSPTNDENSTSLAGLKTLPVTTGMLNMILMCLSFKLPNRFGSLRVLVQ